MDIAVSAYNQLTPDYSGYNIVRGRLIPKPSLARQIVASSKQILLNWDNTYGKDVQEQGSCFTIDMDNNYFWNSGEPCDYVYQYHKGFLAIERDYYFKCMKDYHDNSLIAEYHRMNENDVSLVVSILSCVASLGSDEEVSKLIELALNWTKENPVA